MRVVVAKHDAFCSTLLFFNISAMTSYLCVYYAIVFYIYKVVFITMQSCDLCDELRVIR